MRDSYTICDFLKTIMRPIFPATDTTNFTFFARIRRRTFQRSFLFSPDETARDKIASANDRTHVYRYYKRSYSLSCIRDCKTPCIVHNIRSPHLHVLCKLWFAITILFPAATVCERIFNSTLTSRNRDGKTIIIPALRCNRKYLFIKFTTTAPGKYLPET